MTATKIMEHENPQERRKLSADAQIALIKIREHKREKRKQIEKRISESQEKYLESLLEEVIKYKKLINYEIVYFGSV